MKNQTLLALVTPDYSETDMAPFLERAKELNAHVAFQVVQVSPRFPAASFAVYPYGSVAIPENWQDEYARHAARVEAACKALKTFLCKHDVSGDVTAIYCEFGQVSGLVARRAMVCDRAFVSASLRAYPELFDMALRGILYKSPLGVALNALETLTPMTNGNVMIAWNTGLPAARAVHAALPILLEAEEVHVAVFDPDMTEYGDGQNPGTDIAKWLTHLGCKVTVNQYATGAKEIGTCILERAEELDVDLIVMGAYGHARLREVVFGGTTQTLIEQEMTQVFLAH